MINMTTDQSLLAELKMEIMADNIALEREIADKRAAQQEALDAAQRMNMDIQRLLDLLPVAPECEEYEWIPTAWLQRCFKEIRFEEAKIVKMEPLSFEDVICPHGRIPPDHIGEVKRVSRAAVDEIVQMFGLQPSSERLVGLDACCRKCIAHCVDQVQFANILKVCPPLLCVFSPSTARKQIFGPISVNSFHD